MRHGRVAGVRPGPLHRAGRARLDGGHRLAVRAEGLRGRPAVPRARRVPRLPAGNRLSRTHVRAPGRLLTAGPTRTASSCFIRRRRRRDLARQPARLLGLVGLLGCRLRGPQRRATRRRAPHARALGAAAAVPRAALDSGGGGRRGGRTSVPLRGLPRRRKYQISPAAQAMPSSTPPPPSPSMRPRIPPMNGAGNTVAQGRQPAHRVRAGEHEACQRPDEEARDEQPHEVKENHTDSDTQQRAGCRACLHALPSTRPRAAVSGAGCRRLALSTVSFAPFLSPRTLFSPINSPGGPIEE